VSGLEQEFPGKVTAQNLDATAPSSVAEVKRLGFRTHGLVIRSADGRVLWRQADHTVNMDAVRAQIARLLL
jgi:hypothetical protein